MQQSEADCVADGKKLRKIAAPFPLPPPPVLRFSSSWKLSVEQMAAASLTNKQIAKILEAEAQDCGRCHLRLSSKLGQTNLSESIEIMKQREGKSVADGKKSKKISPPPPASSKFLLSRKLTTPSLTKQEIANYWKQKRKTEEEHFVDAIKAAARIRARNLSEEDYRHFVYSLKVDDDDMENEMVPKNISEINENMKEKRVGIKDWWTKSKYAYLNQPAVKSMERHGSTYIPQLYCYKAPPPPVTSTFGIF